MKELTTVIQSWLDDLEKRWKNLPSEESRRIVRYSFAGYLLITLAVIVQVVYQVSTSNSTLDIEHITNPV